MSECSSPLSELPSTPALSPVLSMSSSPLSIRSTSPSPPPYSYPSPSSTQQSGSRASSRSRDLPAITIDGPPATKKRKLMEPKKRTTEYLDLRESRTDWAQTREEDDIQLQRLVKALHTKQKIVVIAGAGISVSAGIPDFRSSTGLFNTLRSQHKLKASGKHLFDASVYRSDDSTESFHNMVRELSHLTRSAKPTPFHHMLATLAEEGRLLRLYTQNVDGIDTSLPPLSTNVPLNPKGPWPKTIQLHGGLEKMVCTKCGALSDFNGELFEGPEPPSCSDCQTLDHIRTQVAGKRSHGIGRLRPRMVLYNEFNPDEEAIGAVSAADLKARPDAVLVVGTSMKIPGLRRIAKEMCQVTRGRRDGFTAWINLDPEPLGIEFKDCWDIVVRAPCDDIATYAGLPQWDDKDTGEYKLVTLDDVLSAKAKGDVKVTIPAHRAVEQAQGMVTPTASPRRQSPTPLKDIPKIQIKLPGASGKPVAKAKKTASKKSKGSKNGTGAVKATNTLTKSFTVTKTSTAVPKANPKKDSALPSKQDPDTSLSFIDYSPKQPSTPMQTVSQYDRRANSDASAQLQTEQANYVGDETPSKIAHAKDAYTAGKRETISPPSKPRDLVNIID